MIIRGLNKVMAIGNLGADPETRYLPSGSTVTSFSVAVTETWKDKQTGDDKERTEWIRVEVWGKAAEACAKYLRKGKQCYVEGRLQTDKWDDKDGIERWTTKVRADTVQFLGSPRDSQQRDQDGLPPDSRQQAEDAKPPEFDDDIPF